MMLILHSHTRLDLKYHLEAHIVKIINWKSTIFSFCEYSRKIQHYKIKQVENFNCMNILLAMFCPGNIIASQY